jgi:AraC-like DNA-binding protein
MPEPLCFVSGQTPSLLYATKQIVAASAVTRAVHRHARFTEMLYVYQGAGQYVAGGYSYAIRTGDVLLYNQGDLHEVTSSLHHEIGTYCFGLSNLRLGRLAEGHFSDPEHGFVRPAADEIDHIQSLCELIYRHAERHSAYADELVSHLLPALVLLSANLPPDERAADQPHNLVLANRIRQYIGTHFTEQLTLEDIGQALSMSPYHLAHIFKDMTGMSPIHYMIRCRVGEAQNLLISTDYSATQIAAIVGYANVNHFNAIFAKLVGLPPIRYRKQYLENMQGRRLQ